MTPGSEGAERSRPNPTARPNLFAGLIAAVLLVSTIVAGRSYIWCVPMQQVLDSCCHAVDPQDHAQREQPVADRVDCCERRSIAALPIVETPRDLAVTPPPAAVFVLPALEPALRRIATAVAEPSHARLRLDPIRAGPRTASEHCALLRVFRC